MDLRRMEIVRRAVIYFENEKKDLAFLRLAKSQFVESLYHLTNDLRFLFPIHQ